MQTAQPDSPWRDMLRNIIHNTPAKLKELAQVTHVSELTLRRWMNGESTPRLHNLINLLEALPDYHTRLFTLLLVDFPELEKQVQIEPISTELSKVFATKVFDCVQTAPHQMRFWSICQLVLHQALVQLDPTQAGLDVRVMQCMRPLQGGAIRSLRERVGIGTVPWRNSGIILQPKQLFVGAESLAGYAVTRAHPAISQNIQEERTIPCRPLEQEASSAAYPILRAGSVAGCLLVSSAQTSFFTNAKLELIQLFAGFLLLAFNDDEFYESIQLHIMPCYKEQQWAFETFQDRVSHLMTQTTQFPFTSDQAEYQVLQHIENELLTQQAMRPGERTGLSRAVRTSL